MRYAALGPGKRLRPFFAHRDRPDVRPAGARRCCAPPARWNASTPTAWCTTTCRAWTTTTCAAAARPCTRPMTRPPPCWPATRCRPSPSRSWPTPTPTRTARCAPSWCARLAVASGARGMAGGQMIDLLGVRDDLGAVARMQRMKTGALIACAFELPLVMAQASRGGAPRADRPSPRTSASPTRSSTICWTPRATPDLLGKAAGGKDAAKGKANYVTLLGVEQARERRRPADRADQVPPRSVRSARRILAGRRGFRARRARSCTSTSPAAGLDAPAALEPRSSDAPTHALARHRRMLRPTRAAFTLPELRQLADELRAETIDAVSVTGGHLGAGLGVVELTVALHHVFDTPARHPDLGRRPPGLSAQDPHRPARPHPHPAPGRRPFRLHQARRERIRPVRRGARGHLDLGGARLRGRARPARRRQQGDRGDRRRLDERRHGL